MDTKHYSVLIERSDEDGCFIGSAYPLVGQCCHGETRAEVASKLDAIIEDLLNDPDWLKNMPEAAAKTYSGRITLRLSPEEHRLLAARSASRGMSINGYLKVKALS